MLATLKLSVIEKLMNTYTEGTGKLINHKFESGEYEIISFIKESLKVLKAMHNEHPVYDIPDKFIEDFFDLLFKYRPDTV